MSYHNNILVKSFWWQMKLKVLELLAFKSYRQSNHKILLPAFGISIITEFSMNIVSIKNYNRMSLKVIA